MMSINVQILKVCRERFKNFCYLLEDVASGDSVLVDPAWELDKIVEAVRRSGTRCTSILLTHVHRDHVDLAGQLAVMYDIPVYMSDIEIGFYNFRCPHLQGVEEGQRLSLGAGNVIPILTPGHTLGGMCYQVGDNLFTGDTLFAEGCGMCWGSGSSAADLFESLQRLKATIRADTRIFPGHSYGREPGMSFADVLDGNIYLQFRRKEDFISYRMRAGQNGWFDFV